MKDLLFNPSTNKMPIIRIAPVCNGKIYVVPRHSSENKDIHWDLPIEESVEHISSNPEKIASKVKGKYHLHIHSDVSPRFCVQHKLGTTNNTIVFLYVLPIKKEDEIDFHNGHFVDANHIQTHQEQYSHTFLKESELLVMAAELWDSYYS